MNYQQQDNKAMLQKAFLHAAITTATIANFLAAEPRQTSSRCNWKEYKSRQMKVRDEG
jgi:hypothetical protein